MIFLQTDGSAGELSRHVIRFLQWLPMVSMNSVAFMMELLMIWPILIRIESSSKQLVDSVNDVYQYLVLEITDESDSCMKATLG